MATALPLQALLPRFTVSRHPRHLLIIRTIRGKAGRRIVQPAGKFLRIIRAGVAPNYRAKLLTVAWRSVLLPARCLTSTIRRGWHHLTSVSRDDLNAAQDV